MLGTVLLAGGGALVQFERGARLIVEPSEKRRLMTPLALVNQDGGTWRLEEHRGHVVVLNLWATWCGPCWTETPVLNRLAQERASLGLDVVGVSLDSGDRDAKVRRFVDELGVTYPVVFPDPMSQMETGLDGLPTTILLDRKGRVAAIVVGAIEERQLGKNVDALLGER